MMGLFSKLFKTKKNLKYQIGLNKTSDSLLTKLRKILSKKTILDDEVFDDLEELFITSDIGIKTTYKYIEEIKKQVKIKKINDPLLLEEIIIDTINDLYQKDLLRSDLNINNEGLTVYLFVGVNGVGKTSTIAKLAKNLKDKGKKVLLAAADTYRAGAIEQLSELAKRVDVDIITKPSLSDPSSVIFEAINHGKKGNYDYLLCDTAGRLQNKVNLMNELGKIKRIITREISSAPHETLLVMDATTGQNGLSQAKIFSEVTNVSGIVLTKLDGTAKGGVALSIKDEFNLPIKYICFGEKLDDLEVFDIEQYLYGLFAGFFDGR